MQLILHLAPPAVVPEQSMQATVESIVDILDSEGTLYANSPATSITARQPALAAQTLTGSHTPAQI
jgi:hypothetical protein